MPGSIQSVERAAAILKVLGQGPGPLRLSEVSASLQLPKGTVHGLLRTLADVGFVEQDRASGRYRLGPGLAGLDSGRLDHNELRARSMNFADPLAARSGEAVRVAVLSGAEALVVHYVFRPDPAVQHADVGARLPGHASALGKALLAHSPGAIAQLPARGGTSFTARTITARAGLGAELAHVRAQGYAVEFGEHLPDRAGLAAPIFGLGAVLVGAIGVHGDLDRICDSAGAPRGRLLAQVLDCARSISRGLAPSRPGE